MADELNDPVRDRIEGLLVQYGFTNLLVQRRFRIRNKVDGYVGERWMFTVKDAACQQLYGERDTQPHGSATPELFRAFAGEDDLQRFTNFVSNSFPLMKDPWRHFLERSERAFPNDIAHLPDMFEMLSEALHVELRELKIADTQENVNRLLSVRLALGSPLIPGASPVTGLPEELVTWLREEIDLAVLLHAFGPREGKQPLTKLGEPLIPLAEAKQAAGIPIRRLRALYPAGEVPYGSFF